MTSSSTAQQGCTGLSTLDVTWLREQLDRLPGDVEWLNMATAFEAGRLRGPESMSCSTGGVCGRRLFGIFLGSHLTKTGTHAALLGRWS